jgi:zinc transport system substrate-binding protein
MRTILIPAAVAWLALAGCGGGGDGAPNGGDSGTRVVASFYPLAFLAQEVGGAGVQVEDLTPPGVEPHDLELPPRDVAALGDADLVLYLGGGFQPGVEDAVAQSGAEALDLLPAGAEDPHVWLDPMQFADLGVEVSKALTGSGGAAAVLAHRLEDLDAQYRAGLAECERREIVVSHAAFGYLADAYGLEQIPLAGLSPEAEATPRELADAADLVQERGITTIFVEPLAPPNEAETLARETGARVATLDPIEGLTDDETAAGEDYFTRMRANLETLREALGCR